MTRGPTNQGTGDASPRTASTARGPDARYTTRAAGGDTTVSRPRAVGSTAILYLPPWRIEFTLRPDVRLPAPRAKLARLAARTLVAARAPRPASVGLLFSGDAELAELNLRAMGHAGPTDVLSFPLLQPNAFPGHPGQDSAIGRPRDRAAGFVLPPGRRPHLGEVVVSVERAAIQVREGRGGQTGDRRWDVADELRLLLVHGLLHLCGWDHARPDEEAAMRALERELLERDP